MKKKVLLSSVLTIALCLCLITGSTFALFTDETKVNIAVTSGNVEIQSEAEVAQRWSAEGPVDPHENKYLKDENDNYYKHVERDTAFINGGTAEVDATGTLVIDKITPGDKVDVLINTDNLSDVAFIYRYTVSVSENKGLAEGMVFTAHNGDVYEAVKSFTSGWFDVVNPGDAIDPLKISIELPVFAGNEYQSEETDQEDGRLAGERSVKYTILVEAVQSNAVTTKDETFVTVYSTKSAVDTAVAHGGEVVFEDDFNNVITVAAGVDTDLKLNGFAINDNVVNNGTVDIFGGEINRNPANSNACGFENIGGTATLTDVVMTAGDADDYCAIVDGGNVTLDNVDINAGGGGIGVDNGAIVTVNGGSVDVSTTSTSGRYNIYAVGAGTVVYVNGGEYSFSKTLNQKRAYIYAGEGATVYVTGGTFGEASTRSGYTDGILGAGDVIITGGTFGFDPTNWLADGYVATEDNGVWTVTKA